MSEGLGSALGELGQRRVSGLGRVWRVRLCCNREQAEGRDVGNPELSWGQGSRTFCAFQLGLY